MLSLHRFLASLTTIWILFMIVGVAAEEEVQPDEPAADIDAAPTVTTLFHEAAVSLSDETFEHETQASTGQTTGSWLVAFYDKDLTVTGEQDSEYWADHHIVLGSVEADQAPDTIRRFEVDEIPSVLFLHEKRVFIYRGDLSDLTWQKLQLFCERGPISETGSEIPPAPGMLDKLQQMLDDAGLNISMLLAAQIMVVVIGLWVTAVVGATKKPKSETKKGR